MKNKDRGKQYVENLRNWLKESQPETEELTEFEGIPRNELEKQFPSHYIAHDSNTGNLELTTDDGIISCLITNGICTKAYFISNEDE